MKVITLARTMLLGMILGLSGSVGSTAAQVPPPNLAGTYECNGVNPNGTKYVAIVEITRVDDTFRVTWIADGSVVVGVGIYSNGVLAASYFGGAPAVAVYKVDGDRLVGEWTMGGIDGHVYAETLTKIASTRDDKPSPAPRRREPDREAAPAGGLQI